MTFKIKSRVHYRCQDWWQNDMDTATCCQIFSIIKMKNLRRGFFIFQYKILHGTEALSFLANKSKYPCRWCLFPAVPAVLGHARSARSHCALCRQSKPNISHSGHFKTSTRVNSQGGKRPSGWRDRQKTYQPTLPNEILNWRYGGKELAMKPDVIFVAGCAGCSRVAGQGVGSLRFQMGQLE